MKVEPAVLPIAQDRALTRNTRVNLGCVVLRKSKIGFVNPKESGNGFCVSLLNRSIQDLSDHGASKEPKNLLPRSVQDPKDLGLIFLVKKRKILFRILSDLKIQSWVFLKGRQARRD